MRGALDAHGGTVVKLMGDGVMAAFGVPRVAEDDAIRAVRAGVAMQDAFRALARREFAAVGAVGLRVGINTGEVVVGADDTDVVGDPVNVAARLQAEAADGQVVIGEATRRLVAARVTLEPLGSFALRGRAEPIRAYRVESLDRPIGTTTAAFVGRDDELARLTTVYETACTTPAARLAVLVGSPGLGKSRLIAEMGRRVGDVASVVTAHCDAAGGATFAPMAAALRAFFQLETGAGAAAVQAAVEAAIPATDAERARIAAGIAALLAESPASPEETFFVIRRLLAALAAERPVVLVIDDLHWAEPLLLDLVEHLIQWGSGTPLFVLVGARPELRDLRSALVTPGGVVSDVVTLAGLDAGAAMRLAANVVGAADLPAAVVAKVLATTEGNPLFVGELVRMLADEGALERQGERWIVGANLAALEMPPTIHALLAARIERLGPEHRTVLERAAVVGRSFSRSAVAALLGRNGSELDARLEALRRTELIEPDTGWFLGEPVLRFHHVLIRDAAYRRLLKGTRAELHERLADWIEARVQDAPEHDETIGWHLEQAHQHRRELGPLDAQGRMLGERAAQRLAAAGRRALARDDLPVAAGLLGRALQRLAADDPARAALALDWCEALLAAGDVATAETAIDELGRFAGGAAPDPRLAAWHTCFCGQLTVLTAPEALHTTADAVAAAAVTLASLGDAAGEAKGHFVHALVLARLGKVGDCEAALDRALAAARRADDRRRANTVLAIAPLAALWGPGPVTRASGRCLDVVRVLRITQGAPAVEAVALSCQAVLEALRGRTDAARRMIGSARKMVEDLGITQRLLETDVFGGLIDLLEGDAAAAERSLRGAYLGLRDLGLGIDAARAAALLGRALLAQDRAADAEALSHESEALAGDDLKAAIAWRGVRAEALARRGEPAAAVALATEAVGIASTTDALLDHADARLALAAALRAAGRTRDADVEERRAIDLWQAKGATVLVERTRRSSAPVAATAAQPGRAPASRRPLSPNRASATIMRINAAIAATDLAALRAQISETQEEIDYVTGGSWGRDANVAAVERLMRSCDATCRFEPLATLGDSLVLTRRRVHASATGGGRFDVGEYGHDAFTVMEVDDSGRCCRTEVFPADRLGDALARLYQRHAELLPAGPERERAAARARSIALAEGPATAERAALATDPSFELVDHRTLGAWSVRGAPPYLAQLRAQNEFASGFTLRTDDVLAVAPHAVLTRNTHLGIVRATGAAFENVTLGLSVLGADGRVIRHEAWEPDREAEALARFDALVAAGAGPQRPARRRVGANAATAIIERFGTAAAARDLDALASLLSDDVEAVHHRTGVTYGRKGFLATWRSAFRAARMTRRQEIIASLGDALALARHVSCLEGFSEAHLAALGPVEIGEIVTFEADDRGRARRVEMFPEEKLGAAVARLYERHVELLPEGPERERAAATAQSFAVVQRADADPARVAAALAPGFESVDHRHLSSWSLRGADAYLAHLRALREVADDVEFRQLDVLAATPTAQLMRVLHRGTDRAGGGAYERPFLRLFVAGADGRITRAECFDDDREAAALARFDALSGSNPPEASPFENAASRVWRRAIDAWSARDLERFAAPHAPTLRYRDHRRLFQLDLDLADFLDFTRPLLAMSAGRASVDLVATRGERLALTGLTIRMQDDTVGPSTIESLALIETDEHGAIVAYDRWDPDDRDAAHAALDARWEAREETPHERAWWEAVRALERGDWDARAALYAPDLIAHDHRLAGLGVAHGIDLIVRGPQAMLALAPDARLSARHVRACRRGRIVEAAWFGTRDGGAFESPFVAVGEIGPDGRTVRIDFYDPQHVDHALARYAALRDRPGEADGDDTGIAPDWFENAASRTDRELFARFNARDWPGVEALAAPELVFDERRRMLHNTCGREVWLEQFRVLYDVPNAHWTATVLATRGERLALFRLILHGDVGPDGGPLEIDHLWVGGVDDDGRCETIVLFEPGDLDAAYAELDARYEAGEGAVHPPVTSRFREALARRDWDAIAALCGPGFVEHDHRSLAVLGTSASPEACTNDFRALVDLAPDTVARWEHIRPCPRGGLWTMRWEGTRDGGRYEIPLVGVTEADANGTFVRIDFYDPEQMRQALARFAELAASGETPSPSLVKPTAATMAMERLYRSFDARDWDAVRAACSSRFTWEDRRPIVGMSGDVELMIASARERMASGARHERREIIGTAGERVAISRILWAGGPADGRFEVEFLAVHEIDADGLCRALIFFDPDDPRAAQREAWARWAAIDPTVAEMTTNLGALVDGFNAKDLDRLRDGWRDKAPVRRKADRTPLSPTRRLSAGSPPALPVRSGRRSNDSFDTSTTSVGTASDRRARAPTAPVRPVRLDLTRAPDTGPGATRRPPADTRGASATRVSPSPNARPAPRRPPRGHPRAPGAPLRTPRPAHHALRRCGRATGG